MPDITPETHRGVLAILESAQHAITRARQAAGVKEGYQDFDLATCLLAECRDAIEGVRDRAQIVKMLQNAVRTLELWRAGAAAIPVEASCNSLRELIEDLDPNARR